MCRCVRLVTPPPPCDRYLGYLRRMVVGPEPKLPHLQPVTLTSITLQPVPLFTKLRWVGGRCLSEQNLEQYLVRRPAVLFHTSCFFVIICSRFLISVDTILGLQISLSVCWINIIQRVSTLCGLRACRDVFPMSSGRGGRGGRETDRLCGGAPA